MCATAAAVLRAFRSRQRTAARGLRRLRLRRWARMRLAVVM